MGSRSSIEYDNFNIIDDAESNNINDNIITDQSIEQEGSENCKNESICNSGIVYAICSKIEPHIKVMNDTLIPIIQKGKPLSSFTTSEGVELETSITVFNCPQNVSFYISLYCLEEDEEAKPNVETAIDKDCLAAFSFTHKRVSYPINFKSQLEQSGSYKFWVEYNHNSSESPLSIQEEVLLKDSYHKQV